MSIQAPPPSSSASLSQLHSEQLKSGVEDATRPKSLWLNAWHDPLARVRAYSSCLELADINGDGDYKLLVADAEKKLKVYKGQSLVSENALLDSPTAIRSFFMDYSTPRRPAIAVASGSFIFIYKNLRPYYKFTLPPVDISSSEVACWNSLRDGKSSFGQVVDQLSEMREHGVTLSSRSNELLSLDDATAQESFCNQCKTQPLTQLTAITVMSVLNKDREDRQGIQCLVVGTEANQILILDPTGSSILKKISIPSTPAFIDVHGQYDVEFRIVVACRNGNIYMIKNGELMSTLIELDSQPSGVVLNGSSIIVSTMNNVIHSFHIKGKKQHSIYLPSSVANMELLRMESMRVSVALIASLANGEVRIYNGKVLISILDCPDSIMGMRFGHFGREENCLILTYRNGAMSIKILPRQASLESPHGVAAGPPPEQDIPLNLPKKTKLYTEQSQREREMAVDMHRTFQRDLCKLRLTTARSYVKIITDGQGPVSSLPGSSIRLTAQVQGLGPLFKIKLTVQNTGPKPMSDVPIVFSFNQDLYRMRSPTMTIPVLVPSLLYKFEADVECISEGGADSIRVFVCSNSSCIPIIHAVVQMPVSESLLVE